MRQNNKSIVNYKLALIYDSEIDGLGFDIFNSNVHNRSNLMLLIELSGECVIGGYTKTGWTESMVDHDNCIQDSEAFVFHLHSPNKHRSFISNIKKDAISKYNALMYDIDTEMA